MINKTSILFIGTLIPDDSAYIMSGFSRAGNLAQAGVVEGLHKLGYNIEVLSLQTIKAYPYDKTIYRKGKKTRYNNEISLILLPILNIMFVKIFTTAILQFVYAIKWVISNISCKRTIIVYNVYLPPIGLLYIFCKLFRCKCVAIIYDIGVPPKSLNFGIIKRFSYRFAEYFAKLFIPKIDGRIIINKKIADDYAPNEDYLLIDGGITDNTIAQLPTLSVSLNHNTVFLCAGSLLELNGTRLIIDAMKLNRNFSIEIWFAGQGNDVEYIKEYAKTDYRVKYLGLLSRQELFEVYQKVNVLLNIRISEKDNSCYAFPSKLIEYMAIGKFIITTPVAHIKEVYGDYCCILEYEKPEILSNLLTDISKLPKQSLYKTGISAREYILQTHIWDEQCKRISSYIKSL